MKGSVDYSSSRAACRAMFQELIHRGLHLVHVGLALAEPVVQRAEGRVGEQLGHTGNGQRRASGPGAAEVDGVVAQRSLEVLPQPGDELVNEGGELVARGFGEGGRGAAALEVVGEVVVRDGAVAGIGQLIAEGEGTALLGDGLGHVASIVEQAGEGTEHPGTPGGIVLEDLEAVLQFGLRLAEAAQLLPAQWRGSSGWRRCLPPGAPALA